MHELSLVTGLLDIIEQQAVQHGFKEVRVVFLEVGELACVEPEALRFCFEVARRETVAAAAELRLVPAPGRARCQECPAEFGYSHLGQPCPECESYRVEVVAGRELRLSELEVD